MRASRGSSPLTRGKPKSWWLTTYTSAGSSPLTRGKQDEHRRVALGGGLIPAHAGKTIARSAGGMRAWAHPRSRGENSFDHQHARGREGSSPLTRGKREAETGERVLGGLIPAHAGKTRWRRARSPPRKAHPRSRGENAQGRGHSPASGGSSPLTRGKLLHSRWGHGREGLIPAHAGKTDGPERMTRPRRAHPRSRGENFEVRGAFPPDAGSSPLTRGKLDAEGPPPLRGRLIPAHAGKTLRAHLVVGGRAAHPRSRGENVVAASSWGGRQGSSPLTRGKRISCCKNRRAAGLIPAHAGKTYVFKRLELGERAHPRSRGENRRSRSSASRSYGSSPLTRGKLVATSTGTAPSGLIPAHAGKTLGPGLLGCAAAAHPRSRGENRSDRLANWRSWGSSPLTRGKRLGCSSVAVGSGLIPAHAGKTGCPRRCGGGTWAHPRSRGENEMRFRPGWLVWGSSPLTRGKHRVCKHCLGCARLIPAHAGKTKKAGIPDSLAPGSSPLTRGKPDAVVLARVRAGLIPAHAGKTGRSPPGSQSVGAHPRSRGENSSRPRVLRGWVGSSPLTRGKPAPGGRGNGRAGLIPAHAGKTRR